MIWNSEQLHPERLSLAALALTMALGIGTAFGCGDSSSNVSSSGLPSGRASLSQVQRGQYLVSATGCIDCHNRGKNDTSDPNWLAGYITAQPQQGSFQIGPWTTYAANLTPNATTGLGRATDRQVYNALKFGLDPISTADLTILPDLSNFPATPHYLAPPMPWPSFRHLTDSDLWAIVSYLKHGIKAVSNAVPATAGPGGGAPSFWAGSYTPAAAGPAVIPTYPFGNEQFSP